MKRIYINTLPKEYIKKNGEKFWTVLVGVDKKTMLEKVQQEVDVLTMQVFENQVQDFVAYKTAADKNGLKLVLEADEIIITEPKVNTYTNAAGFQVTQTQASCWGEGSPRLNILKRTLEISDELKNLLADK